jgi:ABC-type Zn uptake system ZnuABC Zn-binding protein ZnuA
VDLSDEIDALSMDEESEPHHDQGNDPHVWMDPNNIIIWVDEIAGALAESDPANAAQYQDNAAAYIVKLNELDHWIRDQVDQIPPDSRALVSDHAVFNYFAHAYGFEQVGMIIPALSTNAGSSAQELADLEDAIQERDIKAIFVSVSINPATAQQVAADTGAQIVFVYTGSLSKPGTEADSYLKFMRYNVTAFVNALK